jgi:hypothetical protein
MSTTPTKCAHPICQCTAPEGEKYCSPHCEDSKDMTTLACGCGHASCGEDKL